MKKLALVMGRQGSGKTTRVCEGLRAHFAWRLRWQHHVPMSWRVDIRANIFNHVAFDPADGARLVTGVSLGRRAIPLDEVLSMGRTVVELPNAGYLPPGITAQLNGGRVETRAFVLMPPESAWRSYGGRVGCITSPEYFMTRGSLKADRDAVDYAADCARIRDTVAASGLPATFYMTPDALLSDLVRFLSLWPIHR